MTTPGSSGRTSARRRRDRWWPKARLSLGTILLEPGTTVGDLRIDVSDGLADGSLVDEATLVNPSGRARAGDIRSDSLRGAPLGHRRRRRPRSGRWTARPFPIRARPAVAPTAGSADAAPARRRDAGVDAPARAGAGGTAGGGAGGPGGAAGGAAGRTGQAGHGRRTGTIRRRRRRGRDRTSRHGRRRGTDRTIGRGRRDGTRGCGRRDERRGGTDRTIGRGRRGGARGGRRRVGRHRQALSRGRLQQRQRLRHRLLQGRRVLRHRLH